MVKGYRNRANSTRAAENRRCFLDQSQGIQGIWHERDLVFDAGLMKASADVLKLMMSVFGLTSDVIYD